MDKYINKIMKIRSKMSVHEQALEELRHQLRDAINTAIDEGGISLTKIARSMHVSRQRVWQLRATVERKNAD